MAIEIGGNVPTPVGDTYRGFGADWFNNTAIAAEDWQRAEQSAMLSFERESAFNAAEAQKQRDFEERMATTEYQRAVEDMKKAGINPILAYSQGGNSTPSTNAASSSGGSSSSSKGSVSSGLSDLAQLLGKVVAGLIIKAPVSKSFKIGFGK